MMVGTKLACICVAVVAAMLFLARTDPVAAQRTATVVIDDPINALGNDRAAVRRAASGYKSNKKSGARPKFIVSVVRTLEGRPIGEVADRRFTALAPLGSPQDLLLVLAVDQRAALLTVRDTRLLARDLGIRRSSVMRTLSKASRAGTRRFRSGGAGPAALAAIEEFSTPSGGGKGRQPGAQDALTFLLPVLAIIALVTLIKGLLAWRRLKGFAGGRVQVRDLRPGRAMVAGLALTTQPMPAPVTGRPCVAWELSVKEELQRTRTETQRRTGRDGLERDYEVEVPAGVQTKDLGNRSDWRQFWVRDDTGDVLVTPDHADLKTLTSFDAKVDRSHPAYGLIGAREHHSSNGIRRVTEGVIPAEAAVTVIGPVDVDGGQPQVRWTASSKGRFFITVDAPGRAERSERWRMIRNLSFAATSFAGLVAILLTVHSAP